MATDQPDHYRVGVSMLRAQWCVRKRAGTTISPQVEVHTSQPPTCDIVSQVSTMLTCGLAFPRPTIHPQEPLLGNQAMNLPASKCGQGK